MEKIHQLNQLRERTKEVILSEWVKQETLPTPEEIRAVKVLLSKIESITKGEHYINIAS
jgi:hypothetical protein